jgi:hypothetical protein
MLATVLAGQGDAEHAAGAAMKMLDHATGMESGRIQEHMIAVRDAISGMSDARVRRAGRTDRRHDRCVPWV